MPESIDVEIRKAELAVAIADLNAYRTELIAELERIAPILQHYRATLQRILETGTTDDIESEREDYYRRELDESRKRTVWGRVRDGARQDG